jgi:hypothetical protein
MLSLAKRIIAEVIRTSAKLPMGMSAAREKREPTQMKIS